MVGPLPPMNKKKMRLLYGMCIFWFVYKIMYFSISRLTIFICISGYKDIFLIVKDQLGRGWREVDLNLQLQDHGGGRYFQLILYTMHAYVRTPCPQFGILELSTKHRVCSCCRHASKKNKVTIRKLKLFQISKLTVHSQFFQQKNSWNFYLTGKSSLPPTREGKGILYSVGMLRNANKGQSFSRNIFFQIFSFFSQFFLILFSIKNLKKNSLFFFFFIFFIFESGSDNFSVFSYALL